MSTFTTAEEIPAHFLAAYQAPTPENLELYAACAAGDGSRTEAALAAGGLANYYDEAEGGLTAVHVAAAAADGAALAALLAYAPEDAIRAPLFDLKSTAMKSTPLHEAAAAGRGAQVKALLARGVNVDTVNGYGNTALMLAAAANALDACAALCAAGCKNAAANQRGQTALHMAVAGVGASLRKKEETADVLAVARLLLNKGEADANAADGAGQTPLHHVRLPPVSSFAFFLSLPLLGRGDARERRRPGPREAAPRGWRALEDPRLERPAALGARRRPRDAARRARQAPQEPRAPRHRYRLLSALDSEAGKGRAPPRARRVPPFSAAAAPAAPAPPLLYTHVASRVARGS